MGSSGALSAPLTSRICSGAGPAFRPVTAECIPPKKKHRQIRLGEGPTLGGILSPGPLHVSMTRSVLSLLFLSFLCIYHPTALR